MTQTCGFQFLGLDGSVLRLACWVQPGAQVRPCSTSSAWYRCPTELLPGWLGLVLFARVLGWESMGLCLLALVGVGWLGGLVDRFSFVRPQSGDSWD